MLQSIPSNADIHEIKQVELMENIKEVLDSGNNLNKYMNIVEELTGDDFTSMDVALALISLELKDIEKLNKLSDDLHISYEREGGGERDRKSSGRKADSRGKEKMVRFKIDIGRNHGASINVILSGVARATGLPGSLVGKIEVKDSLSYFDIPEDVAPVVLKSMKNYKVKNKVTNTTVYESGKGKVKDKDKERSRKSKVDSKKR